MRSRGFSLAARIFALQLIAAALVGGALLGALVLDGRARAEADAADLSLAVSRTIAHNPWVADRLTDSDATSELEPYALALIVETGVDFVTIMDPQGIRITHPDVDEIGRPFRGTISEALRGRELTETYTGTLGPSVRAVVPIERDGELVGIVSAGVTTAEIGDIVVARLPFALGIAALAAAVGTAAGAIALVSLRRATGALSPADARRMLDFYESVLHSVREGVVLTDARGRVILYNDEAADLLGLPPADDARLPATAEDLGIDAAVAEPLGTGRSVVEESLLADGAVLLVNQEPARRPGRTGEGPVGAVMTLRDQSVLQQLSGELDSVRTLTDALSSQAHEFSNTLHTIVSLLELGRVEQAVELVTTATRSSQDLTDAVLAQTDDPVLGALLVGKAAQASERGIALEVDLRPGLRIPLPPASTVSLVGNLLDNALDAAARGSGERRVRIALSGDDRTIRLVVEDSGPGFGDQPAAWFEAGATSKTADGGRHGLGLALVRTVIEEAGADLQVASDPTRVTVQFPAAGELR
ncbi:MAG: ATP-binding protein [Naasia sp.]